MRRQLGTRSAHKMTSALAIISAILLSTIEGAQAQGCTDATDAVACGASLT
eukprot:SAG31_NODE_38562_length_295_cov_0.790816_1_plen_50_part_10